MAFVAPVRPARLLSVWEPADRVDICYAVLRHWSGPQLAEFMHVMHGTCIHMPLDRDDDGNCGEACDEEEEKFPMYNTTFWKYHDLPVLLYPPEPAFMNPSRAFLALRDRWLELSEDDDDDNREMRSLIELNMRVVVMIALLHDYRVRELFMVDDWRFHPFLHTRPPERARFWRFLELDAGQQATDYCFTVEQWMSVSDHHQRPDNLWQLVVDATRGLWEKWVLVYPRGLPTT